MAVKVETKVAIRVLGVVACLALLLSHCTLIPDERVSSNAATAVTPKTIVKPQQGGVEYEEGVPLQKDCNDRLSATQAELNECFKLKNFASEQELDALLAIIKPHLRLEQWNELVANQVEWRMFKEKDCKWVEGFFEGGSMAQMQYWSCMNQHNNERIQFLYTAACVNPARWHFDFCNSMQE